MMRLKHSKTCWFYLCICFSLEIENAVYKHHNASLEYLFKKKIDWDRDCNEIYWYDLEWMNDKREIT